MHVTEIDLLEVLTKIKTALKFLKALNNVKSQNKLLVNNNIYNNLLDKYNNLFLKIVGSTDKSILDIVINDKIISRNEELVNMIKQYEGDLNSLDTILTSITGIINGMNNNI